MNGMSEQRLAGASFAKENDRDIGFRTQRGQLKTPRHRLVTGGEAFDFEVGKWLLHTLTRAMVPCFRATGGLAQTRIRPVCDAQQSRGLPLSYRREADRSGLPDRVSLFDRGMPTRRNEFHR